MNDQARSILHFTAADEELRQVPFPGLRSAVSSEHNLGQMQPHSYGPDLGTPKRARQHRDKACTAAVCA